MNGYVGIILRLNNGGLHHASFETIS